MQIQKKRSSFRSHLRKHQRTEFFNSIRQTIVLCRSRQLQNRSDLDTLLLAHQQLQKEDADRLNLFANLEELIERLITDPETDDMLRNIALWFYISLTSDRHVMNFLAQYKLAKEWTNLLIYLQNYPRFREYFYQRLVFLLKISEMSHFDPEKNHLFDAKTTCFLIDLEPEEDCESSYYEFMQEYISIIPKDHLEPIIHAGFAFKAFEFANSTVFLAIVARLQAQGQSNRDFHELYLSLLSKKVEFQAKLQG